MHHHSAIATVDHLAIAAASTMLVALALALFLLCRKKRICAAGADIAPPLLPVCPLADVERATDGFHPSRILGQGRHFTVYAAAPGLAAKRLHPHLVLGEPGGRRFPPSVRSLSSVPRHPNLAALVGLAEGPGERVLLVDRAPAGSAGLDTRLHCGGHHSQLTWRQRVAVAAGAASGLAHLHAHGVPHSRVRPCNILVDAHGHHAMVCDYGMAGFLDEEDCVEACAENDVHGFGVVLLELLTGRRWEQGRLGEWALPRIRAGAAAEVFDASAGAAGDARQLLGRVARVALACAANGRRSRPGMAEVAAILGDVEMAYRRRDGAHPEGTNMRCSGCLGPGGRVQKEEATLQMVCHELDLI